MHAKAAIVAGITVAVLGGGGLALAQSGGAAPARDGTARAADVRATTTISRAEAERIALATAGGGLVRETELESEEGALVWKVEVIAGGLEHDIYVDTRTGDVVRHRLEDANGDGDARRGDARDDIGRDDDGPRHDAGDDHGGLRRDDGRGRDGRNGGDDSGDDRGGGDGSRGEG